jgi:hypothetical protein
VRLGALGESDAHRSVKLRRACPDRAAVKQFECIKYLDSQIRNRSPLRANPLARALEQKLPEIAIPRPKRLSTLNKLL